MDESAKKDPTARERLSCLLGAVAVPADLVEGIEAQIGASSESSKPARRSTRVYGFAAVVLCVVSLGLLVQVPPQATLAEDVYQHVLDERDLEGQFAGDLAQWLVTSGASVPHFVDSLVLAKNCLVGGTPGKHLRFVLLDAGAIDIFVFDLRQARGADARVGVIRQEIALHWETIHPKEDTAVFVFYRTEQAAAVGGQIVRSMFEQSKA